MSCVFRLSLDVLYVILANRVMFVRCVIQVKQVARLVIHARIVRLLASYVILLRIVRVVMCAILARIVMLVRLLMVVLRV